MNFGLSEILGRYAFYDYLILAACLLLIFFAPWIIRRFSDTATIRRRVAFRTNVLRGLAMLIIALQGYYHFYRSGQPIDGWAIRFLSILVVAYLGLLSAFLIDEFLRRKYGRRYVVAGRDRIADTYASRALTLLINIVILIVVLLSIVRIAGFSSWLEAGGVLGIFGVFLALTQGAWAPDIISGLIILNTNMFQERDVIKLWDNHDTLLGTVHRTRVFHTELLNMVDNHRVMIRNSRVRDYTVHNLSRFASARGIRETQRYKIGYDVTPARVRKMFLEAYELAVADTEVLLEEQYPVEVRMADAGDHAIEWSVHYYTKDLQSLVKTGQLFREIILETANAHGISLATPMTHVAMPSGHPRERGDPELA